MGTEVEVGGEVMLTTSGAARRLGVGPKAIRELAGRGELAFERRGPLGWRLFRADEVERAAPRLAETIARSVAGRRAAVGARRTAGPGSATCRQMEVYRFLYDTTRDQGYQPSYREVGERFGFLSPTAVQNFMEALAARGYVRLKGGRSRGLEFLKRPDGTPFSGFAEKGTMS